MRTLERWLAWTILLGIGVGLGLLTSCLPERAAWTADSRTLFFSTGPGLARWDATTGRVQGIALRTAIKNEPLLGGDDKVWSVRMDSAHDRMVLLVQHERQGQRGLATTSESDWSLWQIAKVAGLDPKPTTCTAACAILAGSLAGAAANPRVISPELDLTPDGTLWWLGERGGQGPTSASAVLWQDKGAGAKSLLDLSADLTSGTEFGGMALRVDPTGARVAIPAEEKGTGNDHVLLVRDLPRKTWTRFAMEATPVLWLDASRLLVLGKGENNDTAPLLLLNVESRTTRTLCDRVNGGLTVFAEPGGKSVLVTTMAPPPEAPKSVGLNEPTGEDSTKHFQIERLNLATGAREVLIRGAGEGASGLALSPNGQLLAYSMDAETTASQPTVRVRNLKTSEDKAIWTDKK